MKNNSESGKLRANISIATKITYPRLKTNRLETPKPILLQDSRLPVEAAYEFSNATKSPLSIEIYLFFGNNQFHTDNVALGVFVLEEFPSAPNGPSQIKLNISADVNQMLCISVLDPLIEGYRSVGFINIGKVEPPTIKPPPSSKLPYDMLSELALSYLEKVAHHSPVVGEDIFCDLELTFNEALMGGQKHLEVLQAEICTACSGNGTKSGDMPAKCESCQGTGVQKTERRDGLVRTILFSGRPCPSCQGSGERILDPCTNCRGQKWVKCKHPFTLDIPPSIDSRTKICFLGLGEPGKYDGPPGNLYICVTVAKHTLFTRIGRTISIRLPVSKDFARTGGQLSVPSVDGKGYHDLILPPNTHNGAVFQVIETESYRLNAIIETYNPHNPFALLMKNKRLKAIEKSLNHKDVEVRI